MKNRHNLMAAAVLLFIACPPICSRSTPAAWQPAPMKLPPAGTNSVRWHTVVVKPRPDLPKIHFYNKFSPVWWFGNIDDPVPPAWYRPDSKRRNFQWHLRNPFHNLDFYVIGLADKKFARTSRQSEGISKPRGHWDFAVARCELVVLPYISCQRGRFNFYFGWRERGNFGIKLNFSTPLGKKSSVQIATSYDGNFAA